MTTANRNEHVLNDSDTAALQNRIWKCTDILYADEPFTRSELERKHDVELHSRFWTRKSAWIVVGQVESNADGAKKKINQYRWDESTKRKLQKYVEEQDKLPCPEEHRAHIYNDPEIPSDKLGCRYCAENDTHPEFSKDLVRKLL